MCGKISSIPKYPENFITTNGRKSLEKGVKLHFENNETLFCVIDGTHPVKKHILPEKSEIILASSPLGKILLGKKVGEKGKTEEGKSFTIKTILPPKKVKWVFRLSGLNVE